MKRETWMKLKEKYLMRLCMLVITVAVSAGVFFLSPIISHADSQGKVTVTSVKIRQEASTKAPSIGGAFQGDILTVIGQVQGSDNYTWYKVQKDDNTGYVRGDCMTITDGSTPPTEGQPPAETPVEVSAVNPVSATVSNDSGRIRANGSTTSEILANAPNGAVLTVTGQATGTDGALWYKVSYAAEGSQIEGFIRSDYVTLSGELTPWTEPSSEPPVEPEPPVVVSSAPYAITQDDNFEWCVYPVDDPTQAYELKKVYEVLNALNKGEYVEAKYYSTSQKQKIVIIILVFLLVAAVAGIAFLVFKIRDMMDSAYFNEVENETLRKRSAAAAGKQGGRVMHTVGADKQQPKPSSARPTGSSQGQRPAGASQDQRSQGARPAGASQGQRPAGASQGQRPAGASQDQRPQGARPAGASQGQRPQGVAQGPRHAGSSQGQRPQGAPQGARPENGQGNTQRPQPKGGQRQPRNFMAEDEEEFEFEFLNYNGDDEQ